MQNEIRRHEADAELFVDIETLEVEAQVLKSNLQAYRKMAAGQGRRGWQDDIRRDTAQLQNIAGQLRKLSAQSGNRV